MLRFYQCKQNKRDLVFIILEIGFGYLYLIYLFMYHNSIAAYARACFVLEIL